MLRFFRSAVSGVTGKPHFPPLATEEGQTPEQRLVDFLNEHLTAICAAKNEDLEKGQEPNTFEKFGLDDVNIEQDIPRQGGEEKPEYAKWRVEIRYKGRHPHLVFDDSLTNKVVDLFQIPLSKLSVGSMDRHRLETTVEESAAVEEVAEPAEEADPLEYAAQ